MTGPFAGRTCPEDTYACALDMHVSWSECSGACREGSMPVTHHVIHLEYFKESQGVRHALFRARSLRRRATAK